MYTTSLKTWARSIAIDGIIIAALVAGVVYHIPYALEVSVFFMWWISILGIVLGLLVAFMPVIFQKAAKDLEAELKLERYKDTEARVKELTEKLEKFWSPKLVNRLAVSHTFLVYHWASDIVCWVLLIVAGHPILATFKATSFLISCALIGVAREKYRERLGIKSPDDIEKELAEHRAHLHKTNP